MDCFRRTPAMVSLLLLLATACHAVDLITTNPSFERIPGSDGYALVESFDRPGAVGPETEPIGFPRIRSAAYTGNARAVLSLRDGAVFPSRVRLGQQRTLVAGRRYRMVVWARLDVGTVIGARRGAIVSTFCEQLPEDGGGFVGIDTTFNESPGSFVRGNYRKIVFDVIGDGQMWTCWIGVLGQPSSPPTRVSLSVDDYRVFDMGARGSPELASRNRVRDPGFNKALLSPEYTPLGDNRFRIELPLRDWYEFYYVGLAARPSFAGPGRRLQLGVTPTPGSPAFTGVIQRVPLAGGQRYEVCVDYRREEPAAADMPAGVEFTLFNYYVRLPSQVDFGADALLRDSEGLLLGKVDVRVERNRPVGRSAVQIVAPRGSGQYQLVLKLNEYGNDALAGIPLRMTFDNARVVPIASPAQRGCRLPS